MSQFCEITQRLYSSWRPMGSAPLDGTPVIVDVEDDLGYSMVASFSAEKNHWYRYANGVALNDRLPIYPEGWIPLPSCGRGIPIEIREYRDQARLVRAHLRAEQWALPIDYKIYTLGLES